MPSLQINYLYIFISTPRHTTPLTYLFINLQAVSKHLSATQAHPKAKAAHMQEPQTLVMVWLVTLPKSKGLLLDSEQELFSYSGYAFKLGVPIWGCEVAICYLNADEVLSD